ncbi:hypothetical protein FOPG_19353, partial [Fusarium oxysporum f. sp. conglutinans race 2 54008]
ASDSIWNRPVVQAASKALKTNPNGKYQMASRLVIRYTPY